MKADFNNLSIRTWLLLVIPAVMLGYPVARLLIPAVFHAIVPQVVQTVLSLI